MKFKPLAAALATAGVLVVGTAGAFNLVPHWIRGGDANAASATTATQVALAPASSTPTTPAAVAPAPVAGGALVPNYRAIVKQSAPAVVGISVEGVHKVTAEESGLPPGVEDDPFFKFFRGMPGFQGRGGPAVQPFRGMGSGFIVTSDGLILTNAHVVREAKEVTVKLSDRREYAAKVLGIDTTTDIAVLRIDAKGLPTVRLGDPKQIEVGDPVLAIGAPYGLEQTATQGIVSAKGRSLPGDAVVPFIQTDAAVNPGNSGGPLFDGSGAVVGINAQIYSRSGGFQGLSFAIPIDVALKVKDQIVATGKASHGRLGVAVQDLNQVLAESFGLSRLDGALVASVAPNSAAAAAGLKPGDVILSVNDEPVTRSGALSSVIGMSAPGERVKLKVWRDRSERVIEARLGGADDAATASADSATAPGEGGHLGLALRPLTRDERRQAHVDEGLVVEQVTGPAAKAGVVPGDVLLSINGKPVESVDAVRKVLGGKPKNVALLVQRDGEKIFVPVKIG
ncbi:Do family serine endopeptidase [Piscinibacter koreensis]|uniref:Probable periplasmic serine endoprotease DegP-like n=1 Tax=Piscinibacter koreensis TaxID=2742824 RepID=A0A7Y6NPV2_9BURK|nr:Do family serine endopeptidase [Schlegelella koreensis]NUZ07150.1 Do family serine endopeptidase [Schlegelella koreensis]